MPDRAGSQQRQPNSDKLAFVNLMGMSKAGLALYSGGHAYPSEVAAYRAYLDSVLVPFNGDDLPLPLLCFDNYPFEFPPTDPNYYPQTFFQNLAAVRDAAGKYSRSNYSIPFWAMIQSAPRREHFHNPAVPDNPSPTMAQVRWQAYVSLAYGAKGILYWVARPLAPAPGDEVGYGAFLLDSTDAWFSQSMPKRRNSTRSFTCLGPR
jgi:hypothetical protein